LYHFPQLPTEPFRADFADFPWVEDTQHLAAWQRGATGYPLVDAGMRELWHTGTMHNRVRMVVASFLTKHLRMHWSHGAAWFWDTLVDADLASNSASWQWVAGCGADAAPYFRIFNPMTQSEKFDASGDYIRRWVPELRGLSVSEIHKPWKYTSGYAKPIVEHEAARAAALHAYAIKKDGTHMM
jgi:deoxyribodipyrimidine photo-lyase